MAAVGLADRIRPCIGRQEELAALARLTLDEDVRVVFLHGIPGIGKSALLQTFLSGARAGGASVVALDCRTIEPTERGLHDAIVGSTGRTGALVEHLSTLPAPVVLALDHYEVFRLMDTWLRQVLAPELAPDGPTSSWPDAFRRSRRGTRSAATSRASRSARSARRTPMPSSPTEASRRRMRNG